MPVIVVCRLMCHKRGETINYALPLKTPTSSVQEHECSSHGLYTAVDTYSSAASEGKADTESCISVRE